MIQFSMGVILAGGMATHMNGRNKALLDVGGRPVLEHIIEQATPQLRQLIISANGGAPLSLR
jgi:molybdopterin-guanine dinucleotide biosynthesis protein A